MKDRLVAALRASVFVITTLLVVVSLLRLYECYAIASRINSYKVIPVGIFYDIATALSFSAIVLIPINLILYWSPRIGYALLVGICSLYIGASFGLIHYFSITLLPLGADFFGYTWNDIKTTVSSSGGLSPIPVILLIFFIGLFITLCYLPARQKVQNKVPVSASLVIVCLMFLTLLSGVRATSDSYKTDLEYYTILNKTDFFLQKSSQYFKGSLINDFSSPGYPFLHPLKSDSSLDEYFNLKDSLPNIVFILVEGLGRDFTCEDALYGGFTPFLDSLAGKSLFWKNALSNAGRTFGVLPSVLGSLPYGKKGFMSYGNRMPEHHTIISLLKPYGYASHFFYGGNPNFDNQDIFLERQGINYILDETKFPARYSKVNPNHDGFSWGYPDRDVFNRSLEIISEKKAPRIDIYLTLSTHEPFRVPENSFKALFDLKVKSRDSTQQKTYTEYRNIFECLLYTDDVLKEYFAKAANLPDYNNTIFVITGDHRLIPVPAGNKLSRFHVPLLIYSPMLKKAETFRNIIAHSDVTPAILNLLRGKYNIELPHRVAFISSSPMANRDFSSSLDLALIRNKNETLDYVEGKYMLSENRLFEITPTLDLEPVVNEVKRQQLTEKLNIFKEISLFACEQNQLIKATNGPASNVFTFTNEEESYLNTLQAEKLGSDVLYRQARALAVEKKYTECRALARFVLNKSPNYHDARILLARTFAWDGHYDTARYFLKQVLGRSPNYEDGLMASIDVEYWSGNHEQALSISQGISLENVSTELTARKARSLFMMGKKEEAKKMLMQILKTNPEHPLSLDLLAKLQ